MQSTQQQPLILKGEYLTEADLPRLRTKARAVWDAMLAARYLRPDGQPMHIIWEKQPTDPIFEFSDPDGWIELNGLAKYLNMPHSSLSAAVRAFRYDENGGHQVEVKRVADAKGTFLYRLIPASPAKAAEARARAAARAAGTERPLAYHEGVRDGRLGVLAQIQAMVSSQMGWPNSPALKELTDSINDWVARDAPLTEKGGQRDE